MTGLENGQLDLEAAIFRARSGDVTLTQTEVRLLRYLLERPGQDLSREQLHVDVWGYAPSVQSRSCDTAMRRLRAKVERDPAKPTHLLTVPALGYRFAPLASRETAPSEPENDFIGQVSALQLIQSALDAPGRLVAVTGPPGVGKSRVAAEAVRRADGPPALHLDCSGILDPPQLLCAVADRLSLPPEDAHAAQIGRVLELQPITLFLDNCEHLLEDASTWAGWADRALDARILVTSRTRLPGHRAVEVRVAPLDVADAVRLFAHRSDRVVSVDEADVVREIVTSCDCLPLAIELAAARARLMAPRDLLRRLNRSLTLLRDRSRTPRHATLEATLRVSWELLSHEEQTALGQATVFTGGFDLGAAEAVIQLGVNDTLDVFEALADHSLLRLETKQTGTRITLSETVRAFASERAAETTMSDALRRHAAYYAKMGPSTPDSGWRSSVAKADVENALEATRAMLVTHQWTDAARAWLGAGSQRTGHAPWTQVLELGDALLAGQVPEPWRARVLLIKGLLQRDLRHLQEGTESLQKALALAETLKLNGVRDRAELGLAGLALSRSDLTETEMRLDALAARVEIGREPVFDGLMHRQRFSLAQWQGKSDAAHRHLDAALQSFVMGEAPEEESFARSLLGVLLTTEDRLDLAEVQLRLAVKGIRRHSTPLWLARGLLPLAHNRGRAGAFDEAELLYDEARALFIQIGRVAGAAIATGQMGVMALRRGDEPLAESRLRQAIGVLGGLQGTGFHGQTAILQAALALVLTRTGRRALANTRTNEALAARPLLTSSAMRIAFELMLSETLDALGRLDEAAAARTLAEEYGASPRLLAKSAGLTP